ncbi:MAG: hypothetical protein P4L56_09835 [Candidatus Sulfopaludibacter sp.]|nr:hypothetical protein [Candidatus Sulfopaludibacter sp.]
MRWRIPVAFLMFAAAALAQTPAEGGPPNLLEEARRTALNYSKSLPDFICTELIHRFEGYGPTGPLRPTDVLTLQLTYFQMKENYKLVARNNKSTKASLASVGGAFSQGEFGSKLMLLFHPTSKAEFTFEEWTTIGDRRVAVYTFRVKRVNSHFEMRVAQNSVVAGYHGEVFIDEPTQRVLRVAETIDVPEGFPVQFSHNTEDYDFVDVSGHAYLLPVRCESLAADLPPVRGRGGRLMDTESQKANQIRYRNVIEFRDYRKYAAESTLSFDTPAGPPKE